MLFVSEYGGTWAPVRSRRSVVFAQSQSHEVGATAIAAPVRYGRLASWDFEVNLLTNREGDTSVIVGSPVPRGTHLALYHQRPMLTRCAPQREPA